MTPQTVVPTVNVGKRATVYTVTRPVVASGSMLTLLQPGCRLHIWGSRHSSLGGYIAIAKRLGVSVSAVFKWINKTPYG